MRGTVSVKTMRTDMIIIDIRKFFHCLAERFLGLKLIQICTFVFQRVEISLHRCVVIRISCFAHALSHRDTLSAMVLAVTIS